MFFYLYGREDGVKHTVDAYLDVNDDGKASYRIYFDGKYWSGGESDYSFSDDLKRLKNMYNLSDHPVTLQF